MVENKYQIYSKDHHWYKTIIAYVGTTDLATLEPEEVAVDMEDPFQRWMHQPTMAISEVTERYDNELLINSKFNT